MLEVGVDEFVPAERRERSEAVDDGVVIVGVDATADGVEGVVELEGGGGVEGVRGVLEAAFCGS